MPDRPLILFPSPERADREHKKPVFTKTSIPSYSRQFTRLQPSFSVLNSAFEQKSLEGATISCWNQPGICIGV